MKYLVIVSVAVYHLHNYCYATLPKGKESQAQCHNEATKPQTPASANQTQGSANKKNQTSETHSKTRENRKHKPKTEYRDLNTGNTGKPVKLPGSVEKNEGGFESSKYSSISNTLYKQLMEQFDKKSLDQLKCWERYFFKKNNSMVTVLGKIAKYYEKNEKELINFFKQNNTYIKHKFDDRFSRQNNIILLCFFECVDGLICRYLNENIDLIGIRGKNKLKVSIEILTNVTNLYKICNTSSKVLNCCSAEASGIVNDDVSIACMKRTSELEALSTDDYRISVKRDREQWGEVKGILIKRKIGIKCDSLILHLLYKTEDQNVAITDAKVSLISVILEKLWPKREGVLHVIEQEMLSAIRFFINKLSPENKKKKFYHVYKFWANNFSYLLPKYKFFENENTQCFLLSEKAFDLLTTTKAQRSIRLQRPFKSIIRSYINLNKKTKNEYDLQIHMGEKPSTGFDTRFYVDVLKNHMKEDKQMVNNFMISCEAKTFREYLNTESLKKCVKVIFDNEAFFSSLITNYDVLVSNQIIPDGSRVLIGEFIPGFIDATENCSPDLTWLTPLMLKHLLVSCSVYIDKLYEKQKKQTLTSNDINLLIHIIKLYLFINNMNVKISYGSNYLINLFAGCFNKKNLQEIIKYIVYRVIRSGECQLYPDLFTMNFLECVFEQIQDNGFETSPHIFSYVTKTTKKLKPIKNQLKLLVKKKLKLIPRYPARIPFYVMIKIKFFN